MIFICSVIKFRGTSCCPSRTASTCPCSIDSIKYHLSRTLSSLRNLGWMMNMGFVEHLIAVEQLVERIKFVGEFVVEPPKIRCFHFPWMIWLLSDQLQSQLLEPYQSLWFHRFQTSFHHRFGLGLAWEVLGVVEGALWE